MTHDDDDNGCVTQLNGRAESEPLIEKDMKKRHKCRLFKRMSFMSRHCQLPTCNPSVVLPRTLALLWKNSISIMRRKVLLMYQLLLPLFQVVIAFYGFGAELTDINVAVANRDIGTAVSVCGLSNNYGSDFLSTLDSKTLSLKYFDSTDVAVDQVERGKAWAAITIPANFSIDVLLQGLEMEQLVQLSPNVANRSAIQVYEDLTNTLVSLYFEKELYSSIELYWMKIVESCNISSYKFLQFHDPPVYGTFEISYTDYVIPGFIISAVFIIASIVTGLQFVRERNSGLMDRTWVTGVGVFELVIAQLVLQTFIIIIQVTLIALAVVFIFKIYIVNRVDILLVGLLAILQGITGMSFGLLLSSMCDELTSVNFVLTGLYFPILILSGIIWPVSSMPEVLQYVSVFIPTTFSARAARQILEKGWGLSHMEVVYGFVNQAVWITIFLLLAGIGLKLKK